MTDSQRTSPAMRGIHSSTKQRKLGEVQDFEVDLYLDLQYLDETRAPELESLDVTNANVLHFCNSCINQLSSSIVRASAEAYNATIVGGGGLDCIKDTVRVYDREAVDTFGPGYFSLQVHARLSIVFESDNLLWLELVESIVENGFTKITGGADQFRERLETNYLFFDTVMSVENRSGLAPPALPPSPFPTQAPSDLPSTMPSPNPSGEPTIWIEPSSAPSLRNSASPTAPPSVFASPSMAPTAQAVSAPTSTTPQGISNDPAPNQSFDTAVIAAIVGATVTLLSACCLLLLLIFRCQRKRSRRKSFPKEVALSKRDAHGRHVIPIMVELGDDHLSLADTSLGEYTAGGVRDVHKLQPKKSLGSFDEHSLYTTPYSVNPEEEDYPMLATRVYQVAPATIRNGSILRSGSRTMPNRSALDMSPIQQQRAPVTTNPTDNNASSRPSFKRSIPVDVDSDAPFYDDSMRITKIEPVKNGLSTVQEADAFSNAGIDSEFDDEFTRDASELDVWSCDFDEYDRGSDFYLGDGESKSSSFSRSEASIKKSFPTTSILDQRKPRTRKSENRNEHKVKIQPEVKVQPKKEESQGGVFDSIQSVGNQILSDFLAPPPPPTESKKELKSPASTGSSKTSASSFSSRKAYTGTQDYRLDPSKRGATSQQHTATRNPMTQLLESLSIPAATPEGNESSDLSEFFETAESKADKSNTHEALEDMFLESDSEAEDDIDDDSGMSPSPWLMEETAKVLGSRSVNADTESLGGRSNRSFHSKTTRNRRNGSETSYGSGSRFSAHHISSVMSAVSSTMSNDILEQTGGEVTFKKSTKETIKSEKKRLEAQLAALNDNGTTTSSVTMTNISGASLSLSTLSAQGKKRTNSRRKRVVVMAPSGKLGVILANRHDGNGTVVAELRPESPLEGMLDPGDKLIAVDNVAVEHLECSQITSLIAARADRERRLTVLTSSSVPSNRKQ